MNSRTGCGEIYAIFGNTTLPSTIDLASQADVTIYGIDSWDGAGSSVSAGDVNNDNRDDIIIGDLTITWNVTDKIDWKNTLFVDRKLTQFMTTYAGWMGDTITEDFDYLVHTFGLNSMSAIDIDDTEIIFGIDAHYDTFETTRNSEHSGDTVWNASSYSVGGWFELKKRFDNINVKFSPLILLNGVYWVLVILF